MARVAVLQIERSRAPEPGLAACIAQIERAVLQHRADILVCPELVFAPDDVSEADAATCETFRRALQERASVHGVWIAISLACGAETFTGWLCPDGDAASEVSASDSQVVVTPYGKVGLCAGRAFLQTTQARALAVDGVVLICAPAGVCSATQAGLHLSARALENRVFVALSTSFESSQPPYPTDSVTLPPIAAEPVRTTRGATSQIIGPNGRPLAIAVVEEASLAVAELDLTEVVRGSDDADDSSLWRLRRPELYRSAPAREGTETRSATWSELSVATVEVVYAGSTSETLAAAVAKIDTLAQRGVGLVVLPELFCFESDLQSAPGAAAEDFLMVVRALARVCRDSGLHVVTSLVETCAGELTHVGVVIGQAGIVARQVQLHVPRRHAWARAGRRIENICMPWGNLAIAVGEDALMPELANTYAVHGTTLVAAPMSARFFAHARVTLPALGDQLQSGVVAALRSESSDVDVDDSSASLIVDPQRGTLTKAFAVDGVCSALLTVRRPSDSRSVRRSPSGYRAAV